mmetsp:Transcript_14605/g.33777  ORF Transcript_14605/g.33777 Transcript_14605/m.33777 type:complete len:208 (+) Transcript_14605:1960-2583(+)
MRAHRATRVPTTTPIVGPKLAMVFRTRLVKNWDFRMPLRMVAMEKVTAAQVRVRSDFVKVSAGELNVLLMSETASATKMELIRTEKISSVNRVKYLTRFEPEVMADRNRIAEVHKPVQLYRGRKGTSSARESSFKQVTKASTGPVEPIMVSGCAENREYINPLAAVELTISMVPIALFVAASKSAPNATAGARHAKKRNMVAARHYI